MTLTFERIIVVAIVGLIAWTVLTRSPTKTPDPCPTPICPVPDPPKRKPWLPWRIEAGTPVQGGKTYEGVELMCDLPQSEKKKNVGGRDGAGLCVFTSIEWSARWSNERRLFNFQQQMRSELGGGYPEKVDKMMAKYAQGVEYVQHTGGDLEFLRAAIRTGRMPSVTYGGYDPHYSGYVAHMVCLVHLDDKLAAISDNNFPGDNQIVWMSPEEFQKRWKMGGGGWAVILLNPPPPPVPR